MSDLIKLELNSSIRRDPEHQWRETEDKRILVFPRHKGKQPDFHGFFELGEFEQMIWRKLESSITAKELCLAIQEDIENLGDVEQPSWDEIWDEISGFLSELVESGLIILDSEA